MGIALVTLLVALQNIGSALQLLAVALVVQQIVENGIAPRVLGSVTGLNPFWVLLAILTGARVGGLVGVIVAVPTAVMIKEGLEEIRALTRSTTDETDDAVHSTVEVPVKTVIQEDAEASETLKSR